MAWGAEGDRPGYSCSAYTQLTLLQFASQTQLVPPTNRACRGLSTGPVVSTATATFQGAQPAVEKVTTRSHSPGKERRPHGPKLHPGQRGWQDKADWPAVKSLSAIQRHRDAAEACGPLLSEGGGRQAQRTPLQPNVSESPCFIYKMGMSIKATCIIPSMDMRPFM